MQITRQREDVDKALEHFRKLLEAQLARVESMKAGENWMDYSKQVPIIIGVVGGDGIGPYITAEAVRVLKYLLQEIPHASKHVLVVISQEHFALSH